MPSGRQDFEVRPINREDYGRVGRVLGRAFSRDPLWSQLMPEARLRALMFTGTVKLVIDAGGTVETTDELEAAALWMPPGRTIGFGAMARSGLAPARWMMRTSWRNLRRMMALHNEVQERRRHLMPEPHWCLDVLGVDPEYQGQGVGSSLVRSGVERADQDRVPTYVDTSAEANVGFYERFGFELIERTTVTDLEMPFWIMARATQPRP